MNTVSAAPLSPALLDAVERAIAEVASSGGGFGIVSIVIEKGEPRRVQQTKDYLLRQRVNESPP